MYIYSRVITNTARLTYFYNVGEPEPVARFGIQEDVTPFQASPKFFTIEDSVRNNLRVTIPTDIFTNFKNYKNHVCFNCMPLHQLHSIKQALTKATYELYDCNYYNLLLISANLCTIISYASHHKKQYKVFTKPIKLKIWLPKCVNYEPVFNLNLRISQIYLHQISCNHLSFNTIIKYNIEYIRPNPFLS